MTTPTIDFDYQPWRFPPAAGRVLLRKAQATGKSEHLISGMHELNPHVKGVTMQLPSEIWINGDICSGKDYVGDVLAEVGYWKHGVGQLIATEIEAENGWNSGYIYGTPGLKDKMRTELQEWGNMRRAQDPHYWCKKWCEHRDLRGGKAVQTSCRFTFEGEAALRRGAFIIKLRVDEAVRQERIRKIYPSFNQAHADNPAEGEVSRVPYHVLLYGSLPRSEIIPSLVELYRIWQRAGCPTIRPRS